MKNTKPPHPLILEEIDLHYTYDPQTGIVCREGEPIGTKRKSNNTVTYLIMNVAITSDDYLTLYSPCLVHLIAWYLTYGVWPADKFVDHIDGDGMNNRINNLRLATPTQNIRNSAKHNKTSSSIYKGVSIHKRGNYVRWLATIAYDGKRNCLGYYRTPEEAALAYNARALEVFGEHARLNIIGIGCP